MNTLHRSHGESPLTLRALTFAGIALSAAIGAITTIATSGIDARVMYFIPLGAFILAYEALRARKHEPWDFLSVIHVMFLLAYVLGPVHFLLTPSKVNHFYAYVPPSGSIEPAAISVYLGYAALIFGYSNGHRLGNASRRILGRCHSLRREVRVDLLAWGLVALGALSFFAYADAYGGPTTLLRSSAKIRGTHGAESGAVVFRHFMPFANLGVWLLICRYVLGRRDIRRWLPVLPALAVGILVPFANAGRGDALLLVVPALVGPFVLKHRWPPASLLLPLALTAALWILGGKLFFADLSYNTDPRLPDTPSSTYYALMSEFTIPFESLTTAVDRVGREVRPRYIADFQRGLVELVPSRLLGTSPSTDDTVTVVNSTYVASQRSHFLPPGLIGYLFYAGFSAGVVLGGVLFGLACALVEARLLRYSDIHSFWAFLYVAAALTVGQYLMAGDPRIYILNYFWLYLGGCLVLRFLKGKPSAASQHGPADSRPLAPVPPAGSRAEFHGGVATADFPQ